MRCFVGFFLCVIVVEIFGYLDLEVVMNVRSKGEVLRDFKDLILSWL